MTMPLFPIVARDRPDSLPVRMEARPAHLDHLRSLGNRLKVAGPTVDENGDPNGSLVVIEADGIEEARSFADADPYGEAGLFEHVEVRLWKALLGEWSEG